MLWLTIIVQWLHVFLGIFWFGTAYGITFFVAFLTAVATYMWGLFVLTPTAKKLEVVPMDEKAEMIYTANLKRLERFGQLELLGFVGILTCMILMRFGY